MSETKNKDRGFALIKDGKEGPWMIVSDYCKEMLKQKDVSMTPQAVYYRCKPEIGILESKVEHGVRLVREKNLKEGTRVYDRYFRTRTCP
jgi:hypothetical protein